MAVRNFYVEADIDGRKTMLAGGPKCKDGGMKVTLYQRDEGEIRTVFNIRCTECDGKLFTRIYVNGELDKEIETER